MNNDVKGSDTKDKVLLFLYVVLFLFTPLVVSSIWNFWIGVVAVFVESIIVSSYLFGSKNRDNLSLKQQDEDDQVVAFLGVLTFIILSPPMLCFIFVDEVAAYFLTAALSIISYFVILNVAKRKPKVVEGTEHDIPFDDEFLDKGWIVGDWFNHDMLSTALSVSGNDWDDARNIMQKIAYEITNPSHPEEQKQWFKEIMALFVSQDPVYTKTIDKLKKALVENPGLIQSSIYKHRSEPEKKMSRYVLYFADELGDIYRKKSGNSYRLYLSEDEYLQSLENKEQITNKKTKKR